MLALLPALLGIGVQATGMLLASPSATDSATWFHALSAAALLLAAWAVRGCWRALQDAASTPDPATQSLLLTWASAFALLSASVSEHWPSLATMLNPGATAMVAAVDAGEAQLSARATAPQAAADAVRRGSGVLA